MKPQNSKGRAEERLAYTKTLCFQLHVVGLEMRMFLCIIATELRLHELLDWLEEKIRRRRK